MTNSSKAQDVAYKMLEQDCNYYQSMYQKELEKNRQLQEKLNQTNEEFSKLLYEMKLHDNSNKYIGFTELNNNDVFNMQQMAMSSPPRELDFCFELDDNNIILNMIHNIIYKPFHINSDIKIGHKYWFANEEQSNCYLQFDATNDKLVILNDPNWLQAKIICQHDNNIFITQVRFYKSKNLHLINNFPLVKYDICLKGQFNIPYNNWLYDTYNRLFNFESCSYRLYYDRYENDTRKSIKL